MKPAYHSKHSNINLRKNVSKSGKSLPGPSREFAPVLRRVSMASWLLKLLPIPIGLWNARLLSRTVNCAVSGDSAGVLRAGGFLLLLLALAKAFAFLSGAAYGRAASQALHRCKLLLYRRFLSCPLSLLYTAGHGQATELMNDDFDTVTRKRLNLYPCFFTGLAAFFAYFFFLLAQNVPAALALCGISLLQGIPPLIVKGVFEKNYSDTRDIEADITNCTLECYHGFTAVKIFALKNWCLERLSRLHRDYLKIGNRSEAACQAQVAMNRLVGNILTYGTYGLMGLFLLQGTLTLDTGVDARKALSLAARFHLGEEQRKQPLDTLSGGQRKKAFLALALALDPELLLLDEPGNSLDEDSRRLLAGLLKNRAGTTVLVTHDSAFDGAADTFYTLENRKR